MEQFLFAALIVHFDTIREQLDQLFSLIQPSG
jgi:hypothetical protein